MAREMKKKLETIAREDGRFSPGIVRFVYEGLAYTLKKEADEPGHITGQALCMGLKDMAVEKWGRLAMLVLNTGGIKTTGDFGEIVFLLIKNKWMSAQPADSIEDFSGVYDFKTIFKDQFEF